jgi:hypothetical protein
MTPSELSVLVRQIGTDHKSKSTGMASAQRASCRARAETALLIVNATRCGSVLATPQALDKPSEMAHLHDIGTLIASGHSCFHETANYFRQLTQTLQPLFTLLSIKHQTHVASPSSFTISNVIETSLRTLSHFSNTFINFFPHVLPTADIQLLPSCNER